MIEQVPLKLAPQRKHSISNYILDKNNQEIITAIQNISQNSKQWRFIYLWGLAYGKSHLLQAAVTASESAFYLPLKHINKSPQLFDNLTDYQLIALDDIEQIRGDKVTQVAIFNLFNQLKEQRHQLIVSSKMPAPQLDFELKDLQSRLSWGETYQLQGLSDTAMRNLLKQLATDYAMELGDKETDYLINHFSRDTKDQVYLMRLVDRLTLSQQKRRITLPLLRQAIEQVSETVG